MKTQIKRALVGLAGLVLFIICSTGARAADLVGVMPSGTLTLSDKACTNRKIVAQILPQFVADFKAGRYVITNPALAKQLGVDGFDVCWSDEKEDGYLIVDEFGDAIGLDPAIFGKGVTREGI